MSKKTKKKNEGSALPIIIAIIALILLMIIGLFAMFIIQSRIAKTDDWFAGLKPQTEQEPTETIDRQAPKDSDGDGIPDEIEEIMGTDPNVAETADQAAEPAEPAEPAIDTDGDGIPDELEEIMGTDPNVAES